MELYAAIDLLDGQARRLQQGDYQRPLSQSADPLRLADAWLRAGLRWLHVVDLDGARLGRPVNTAVVSEICRQAAASGAGVQVGGGLRDAASVEQVLDAGAGLVMLGSAAVADPRFAAECAQRWPDRIGVSLDLRGGLPAVDGWRRRSQRDAFELAAELLDSSVTRLAVTDTQRDGTNEGPNMELLEGFRARFPASTLLAAGGIAGTAHLEALAALGMDGAIVGRALLEGTLDITEALAACSGVRAA
ncbi:MAG TPA: HisA/HisF-related TIM barrel protein [Candidatus Limnocylindria bacterium]|nr:HisA/HisF-related TIM barrel protein [Candidatus Limnocylindria bacterium]